MSANEVTSTIADLGGAECFCQGTRHFRLGAFGSGFVTAFGSSGDGT